MMVRGDFSELMAPGLNDVFTTTYGEVPSVWEQLFEMNSSDRGWEEDLSHAGFEGFQPYEELEDIQLRDAKQGFKTRYAHRKWGGGYQLSRELVDDNLYSGVVERFPAELARAGRKTKETVAASTFNLGFAAPISGGRPGGDGQQLFSTAHPMAGATGGTNSNTFATARALSHSALKDAIVAMKKNRDDTDTIDPISPSILLLPTELVFDAKEILGTDKVPYSADNTTNVLTSEGLTILEWPYLTDPAAWFLLAPKGQTRLRYFERWALEQHFEDITRNQSMVHYTFERYSLGFSDYRGTFGVPGN